MYTFLIIVLILICLMLVVAILLQAGKGGGLAASFGGAGGTDTLIGGRQAGNLLTRVSWWGGGLFLFLSFVLQLMSLRTRTPRSILDQAFTPAPATAPPTGGATVPLEPKSPEAPPTTAPKQP